MSVTVKKIATFNILSKYLVLDGEIKLQVKRSFVVAQILDYPVCMCVL